MDILLGIFKILGYTAVFALILFLAHYTTRFIASKKLINKGETKIDVKERFFLSRDKEFILVAVKDKEYFIGISQSGFDIIDTFENRDGIDEEKY